MLKSLRCSGTHRVRSQASPACSSSGKDPMKKLLWERGVLLHWSLRKKAGPAQKEYFPFEILFSLKLEQDPPWTLVCCSPSPSLLAFFFSFLITHFYFLNHFPLQSSIASTLAGVLLLQTWHHTQEWSLGLSGTSRYWLSLLQGCAGWIPHTLVLVVLKHPVLPPVPFSQPSCVQRHILAGPQTPFTTAGCGWPGMSRCWQTTRVMTLTWRSQYLEISLHTKAKLSAMRWAGDSGWQGSHRGPTGSFLIHNETSHCFQETAPTCRARAKVQVKKVTWASWARLSGRKHLKSTLCWNFGHSSCKAELICRTP